MTPAARAYQRLGALEARAEVMYEADDPETRRATLRAMRSEAEEILADEGTEADPALRSRIFLTLAAASFSLAHLSREPERERLSDHAIADCELAVAATDRLDPATHVESLSGILALVVAASFAIDSPRRARLDLFARDLATRLQALVPTRDVLAVTLETAAERADVALTSVLRRSGTASATETLRILRSYCALEDTT